MQLRHEQVPEVVQRKKWFTRPGGEVREGLSDIKASTGFRRPRGICQLDKERNGIPEERAWAKAREHGTPWYVGRITWNSVLRALPGHRVQTEQNREQRDTASRWVHATQILVMFGYRDNKKSVKCQITDLQKFLWLQGVGSIRWNQKQRFSRWELIRAYIKAVAVIISRKSQIWDVFRK